MTFLKREQSHLLAHLKHKDGGETPLPPSLASSGQSWSLKRLRTTYEDFARDAEANNQTYEPYLLALLELEVQQRDERTRRARIKAAKFPVMKTLDGFNFSVVPERNQSRILTLSQNDYVDRHENVLMMIGPCGVGKTHLAVAPGSPQESTGPDHSRACE